MFFACLSCSEDFESRYSDYNSLIQASAGEQSWFPDIVSSDCSDLKEVHNIDINSTFGRFRYSTDRLPKLLSSDKFDIVTWSSFDNFCLSKTQPARPKWFIDYHQGIKFYSQKDLLFAIDTVNQIVYFVR
jgi:hypothetical protein